MTTEQQTILLIKGVISELPSVERDQCTFLANQLRDLLREHPIAGPLAIALVGAEMQTGESA